MPENTSELFEFLHQRFKELLLSTVDYKFVSPLREGIKSEASVLILLDKRDNDWYVFLTLRSEKMRSYAGEVSFPGGKREQADRSYVETALREAHEETGLSFSSVEVVGVCSPILSKFQVLIHPVFALLKCPFEERPNEEVQRCFWLPLEHFLKKSHYKLVNVTKTFRMHWFKFPSNDVVYGLTAYLCVLTAMLVYNKYPEFSISRSEVGLFDQHQPIPQFVQQQFDYELKKNVNHVLDVKDYNDNKKQGKL